MDAHEWNESLDRIISTIAEMIDLLKNESRRWATSPIFSTPLPSPATDSPPPKMAASISTSTIVNIQSTPEHQPEPAAKIVTLQPNPDPKPSASIPTNTKSSTHNTESLTRVAPPFKRTPSPISPPSLEMTGRATVKATTLITMATMLKTDVISTKTKKKTTTFIHATVRREWRPPWHSVPTSPNTIGRVEWRPPWRNTKFHPGSSLRTRMFRGGEIVMCQSLGP
ncbi:hypothetical protein HanRHA438_Chr14g0678471 [Helianthus annuus]|nr:hypothetical protein HanRHA438_Chr14g0678471 [Helianthus annuus]